MANNTVSSSGVALLAALVLLGSTQLKECGGAAAVASSAAGSWATSPDGPCDEFYVVGEDETLHTISDKCNDPFILERNPQVDASDDVFPGLVLRIVPFQPHAF